MGKGARKINSEYQKICLPPDPNQSYMLAVPSHKRGVAHVTNAGRDAMDAGMLLTRAFAADGEVVWS